MPTYNVHLYREMRLAYTNVEAETPETAAMIARDFADRKEQPVAEDCDGETFAAVVDVEGDEDFSQSQTIDFEAQRSLNAAPKLLEALQLWISGAPLDEFDQACRIAVAQATITPAKREGSRMTITAPSRDALLDALEDLMIQADEDCPIERRSSHFSNALTQAMLLLEMSKGAV